MTENTRGKELLEKLENGPTIPTCEHDDCDRNVSTSGEHKHCLFHELTE